MPRQSSEFGRSGDCFPKGRTSDLGVGGENPRRWFLRRSSGTAFLKVGLSGGWLDIWMFLKIGVVKPPKSSILIGFSIIFTIHFGCFPPIFGKHPLCFLFDDDFFCPKKNTNFNWDQEMGLSFFFWGGNQS